ncbi:MAG: PAS domain S-box protein [Proteobacteria bacterium]|nr:PAS domain S-box protein [Desulfobacula sp.]MBU3951911.1 PAS domain S-box protein [Pseudomonadota bacterium]MBU4129248.1 PAS domain S-box protein [Pseudomonadota bacterium]
MRQDTDETHALKEKIKALEEENQMLNKIILKAPIPIFVLDKDHKITHFNQALEELTGLGANQMRGTDSQWKAFYAKKRPVMADLIIDNSSDQGIIEHYGYKYNRTISGKGRFSATDFFPDLPPSGRWLFFTASTFTNSQGEIAGAVETLQDVTEEKIQEQKINELYRIYRNVLEFIPYPIIVYGDEGLVSYLNPAFTTTFGWTLEELFGKSLHFVPQSLEAETIDILTQFREDKQLGRYETQRLTRDGKILDVVIWAASHKRFKEHKKETFVILRNITEEKRLAANNKTIMRISAALPEYLDLEELMDYITQEVKNLLNTEGAVVLLYDEIKEDLFFLGASYDDSDTQERAKEFRFTLDEVFAGKVLKSGQAEVVNDADFLLKTYPERDKKLGYQTRSIMGVPIRSDGRIIGVLCAINKKANLFDDNDMELMTMLAGTAAISIENARFSDALKDAYRDVASLNRAKGKAINHLSHELKTPVAILTGSLQILRKKLSALPHVKMDATLNRIERNLSRIVDIQDEVADIMENKTYEARILLLKMLETCQDELETLVEQCLHEENFNFDHLSESVRQLIDREFGHRSLHHKTIDLLTAFTDLFHGMTPAFHFRRIEINTDFQEGLAPLLIPQEVLDKVMGGLIKNAIENTPDQGRIDICARNQDNGTLFMVHDFGVGIEKDNQKRIFEGFFSTQESLVYSTKTPFEFNAGGKGADLLRMKLFSDRLGFTLQMDSRRCCFLLENKDETCPGDILKCKFCTCQADCLNSGHTTFSVFFPNETSL